MVYAISEKTPVARKEYGCDACGLLLESLPDAVEEMTFTEKRAFVKARRNNFKIVKGQRYRNAFCNDMGEVFTYRAIPEIDEIVQRLEWYGDY